MKITICGSIQFIEEMKNIQNQLINLGHEVLMPKSAQEEKDKSYWTKLKQENEDEYSKIKGELIKKHFEKIDGSDAILVLNFEKNGKKNYIGANTFIEMGFAFGIDKKIFILNNLPIDQNNYDEIIGMQPIVLNNNLDLIN